MNSSRSKRIPNWDDFATFRDMGELEHVCYLFETAASEGWGDVSDIAGGKSYLAERLDAQDRRSHEILEAERPGLYEKTWMAHLMQQLFNTLYRLRKQPSLLPSELPGLLLNFHKVLIAAHEIYDPVHRAGLIAKATDDAISERARKAVNVRHEAPGGARDLRLEAWKLFGSGDYGTKKDNAAEPISKKLGVAYSTARKYLRGNPPNQPAA
jgi:hypothetical protein